MLPGSITFYLFRILSFRLELQAALDVNQGPLSFAAQGYLLRFMSITYIP